MKSEILWIILGALGAGGGLLLLRWLNENFRIPIISDLLNIFGSDRNANGRGMDKISRGHEQSRKLHQAASEGIERAKNLTEQAGYDNSDARERVDKSFELNDEARRNIKEGRDLVERISKRNKYKTKK